MLKLLPLLFLISCAKDLTVEEYRQQQSQEMLNQISLVSGTYSGTIVSKIDQENLGQLSISLSPQSTIQATSGVYSEQAASVSGQLIYYGIRKIQVKFDNAFFNPNSNAVIININNNPEEKIVIHGTIESGQFRGDIELAGQSNFGASFSLNKNARPD